MAEKVVVIVSGGMDSCTLLRDVVSTLTKIPGSEVYALSFLYGQKHSRELQCAAWQCKKLGIPHQIVNMKKIGKQLLSASCLTGDIPVPEGHYAEKNMVLTVVPNRNMIMLSLAIGYAVSIKAGSVWYGAHAGDHDIYPDCRKEFVEAMRVVAKLCDWNPVRIEAPYLDVDKGDIVQIGLKLGLNFKKTHTCYNGTEIACGRCSACCERVSAFVKAGAVDPVQYEGGWDATVAHVKQVEEEFKKANPK